MRILVLLSLIFALYLIWFYPFKKSLKVKCADGSNLILSRDFVELGDKRFGLNLIRRISVERVGEGLFELKVDTGSSIIMAVLDKGSVKKVLKFLGDSIS